MKELLIALLVGVLCMTGLYAQQQRDIYRKNLGKYDVNHLVIQQHFGLVTVQPVAGTLSGRATLSSGELDDETLYQLDQWIDILEDVRGDTLVLTTTYDDRFGQPGAKMAEHFSQARLKLEMRVPEHMSIEVKVKQGDVLLGELSNTVTIAAEMSSIKARQMDTLYLKGSYILAYLTRIQHVNMDVSDSEVETIVMKDGHIAARRCKMSAQGYQTLWAELEDVSVSLGTTDTCQITMTRGSITCSNLVSQARFTTIDAVVGISRTPMHLEFVTTRGRLHMASDKVRSTQTHLSCQDSEVIIDPRYRMVSLATFEDRYATWTLDKQAIDRSQVSGLSTATDAHLMLSGMLTGGQMRLTKMRQ